MHTYILIMDYIVQRMSLHIGCSQWVVPMRRWTSDGDPGRQHSDSTAQLEQSAEVGGAVSTSEAAGLADVTVAEGDGLAITAALRWQHRVRCERRPCRLTFLELNRTISKYGLYKLVRV